MRDHHTIYLDDLSDHLQLTDEGANATWPKPEIELTLKWQAAEPDVGIMSDFAYPQDATYILDGQRFTDEGEFVDALYAIIGDYCEEGPDEIKSMIAARIDNEEIEA